LNKPLINLLLNKMSDKKEEAMKKSLGIGLLVVLMSFALTMLAYGADRLMVQDPGGNTKFVVQENGKMGVGTNAPAAMFHIAEENGSAVDRGMISSQHDNVPYAAVFQYKRSRGTAAVPTSLLNGDSIGAFHFEAYDGSSYQYVGSFLSKINGTVSANNVPAELWFHVGNNSTNNFGPPKMVIKSNGYVGLGTATPAYPLQMASGARCTTGGVWTNASSKEYKENISDLSADQALLAFNKLNPVTFNYKVDAAEKHVGFIAEDVPDLVATPDRKALSTMDIVAVLTKVVQEQQKTIADLNEKVTRLEQQVK